MTYPLLIALLVLVAFFRAIVWGGYCIDDEDVFKQDKTPKNKWQKLYWQIRGIKYSDPQVEHLISIIIHLINCELIYFAFGHIAKDLIPNSYQVSFLTALFFAVNPAGMQGSVWLSGKGYSISTMFILLMWWICPLFYLATVPFSFNALFAPLLFIRKQWWWILLIPIYRHLAKGEKRVALERLDSATGKGREFSFKKAIIAIKTLGYYTCLALFPVRLGIYHTFLYTYTLTEADNRKCESPIHTSVLDSVMVDCSWERVIRVTTETNDKMARDRQRFYILWALTVILFLLTLWRVSEQETACHEWSFIKNSNGELAIQVINLTTLHTARLPNDYEYWKLNYSLVNSTNLSSRMRVSTRDP